ncbi:MAG: Rrf2 family transcriptional regulator [Patescibacteria group bacterium]|nr:Rrf2 family transcriptional regulator [Patescibacteria group bacterium]
MAFFAKISTKEHYGLQLALQLAQTYFTKKPVSLAEISKAENISLKYLEQLIIPFKKGKWIKSVRGREGGYLMIKDPKKISLQDMIKMMDSDMSVVSCLCKGSSCKLSSKCASQKAWRQVQAAIEKALEDVKFADLIK